MTQPLPSSEATSESHWVTDGLSKESPFSKVYRSGRRRSRIAMAILAAIALLAAISILTQVDGFGLISRAQAGTLGDTEAADFDTFSLDGAACWVAGRARRKDPRRSPVRSSAGIQRIASDRLRPAQ
jgi:hypothetical protein